MNHKSKSKKLNESNADTLVPLLRFPAFREAEEWANVLLNEIAIPVLDRVVKGETYPVISFSTEHGLVQQDESFGNKASGETLKRYFKVERDDFVFNEGPSTGTICGSIKRLSKFSDGMVSPVYKCFRFNSNEVPAFWEYYFESQLFRVQLSSLIDKDLRGGRFNLSIRRLLSARLWRPCVAEQKVIAGFFTDLDKLLSAQVRKISVLRTERKGLMLQLFPSEGEGRPPLRFPRFRDDGGWKDYLFGDILRITVGREFKSSEHSSAGVRLLQSKSLAARKVQWSESAVYLPVNYEREYPELIVRGGDVVLALSNPLINGELRLARVERDQAISILNQRVGRLEIVSDLVCMDFVFQYCQKVIRDFYVKDIAGKGYSLISLKSLYSQRIYLPTLPEQTYISQCISSLDNLIAMHTKKLEKLNMHKEALMQKLFPRLDEVDA